MAKNIGKNMTKNVTGKYSQKILDHAKQSPTDGLITTSKIGSRITKISKSLPQNSLKTITI